jgi:hypothetical protein
MDRGNQYWQRILKTKRGEAEKQDGRDAEERKRESGKL